MHLEARALLALAERRDYWAPLLGGTGQTATVVRIAEQDGQVVGLVSSVARVSEGEVPALHVDPLLHGRGLGRRLLDAALDDLRYAGCRSAWLTVLSVNRAAIAFYEHLGWTADGLPFWERMDGLDELPLVELVRYRLAL